MSKRYEGQGTAPGTCGELVQGFLSDGTPFHVSAPIDLYSSVSVLMEESPEWVFIGDAVNLSKIQQSIKLTCDWLVPDRPSPAFKVSVSRKTQLDTGKGMGSSTADILAASRAAVRALGIEDVPGPWWESQLACNIESSDGSMYNKPVVMDHKSGSLLCNLPWAPNYGVIMHIPDVGISTSSVDNSWRKKLSSEYDDILRGLESASDLNYTTMFSEAVILDYLLEMRHRASLYHDGSYSDLFLMTRESLGADAMCTAHTGTVRGLLFDLDRLSEDWGSFSQKVINTLNSMITYDNAYLYGQKLISGNYGRFVATKMLTNNKKDS